VDGTCEGGIQNGDVGNQGRSDRCCRREGILNDGCDVALVTTIVVRNSRDMCIIFHAANAELFSS